jgi:hypothetical protein
MDFAAIAREAGCLDTACEDAARRCAARFEGETPSPEAVQAWLTQTLRTSAPHLFPPAQSLAARVGLSEQAFNAMPPSWRLEQAHTYQPRTQTPHPRRPIYRNLTPAELEELAATGLTGPARTEWARARQQTPLPQGQG